MRGSPIATVAEVRDALDGLWSETDYENRMVALVCFAIEDASGGDEESEARWVLGRIRAHEGVSMAVPWPCFFAVFLRLNDAVGCVSALRGRLKKRFRAGVNLDELGLASEGRPGSGMTLAHRLMEQSEPGGITISALTGDAVTARVGGDDELAGKETGWRPPLFAALQWGALLAWFLGFCYLIHWRVSYFAVHGSYPCWPDWLCN